MNFAAIKKPALSILIFSIAVIIPYLQAAEDGPICSLADPDSSKTCISIKFPWKEEPVYFCTAKENVNYVPQCDDLTQSSSGNACYDDGRNDTLKIATPWDCCPYISTPNHCANVKCPPKPFNRTCKDTRTQGQCCPTYFCDNDEPTSCKLKRMKSSCMKPPKDKTNCTVFRDPYGCCAKFQCEGDEKPGNCSNPVIGESISRQQVSVSTSNGYGSSITVVNNKGNKPAPFPSIHQQSIFYGNEMRCIGDNTCPDDMKCCPFGASIYSSNVQAQWNNGANIPLHQSQSSQIKLIDGICKKPASVNESDSDQGQPQ